jgi:hypothetical protein
MNEIEAKAEIGKQQDNRFERVFRELIDDHLQRSLFEGRENELNELAEIANTKEGYYRLGGFAGQGKTALIARLHRQVEPKNPAGQIWLWHFCGRTDQRNSGYRFMVSMLSQLSKKAGGAFGGAEWEGKGLEELFREFGDLLGKAQAATGQKLILVIDALDEAAAPGEYALPNCLPRELPKGCCAIITNRLDKDGRSLIDLGRLVNQVNDLRPLQNLPAQTVHRVLERLETELAQKDNRDPVEIPNELAQAVYARIAQGHALFLRAMVDAIRAGDIVIDDISTYPESLNDYFDTIWNDLPTAHNLLAQRFLLTLAVLREYAWDDLMAQILVESYRPTEEAGRRPSLDPELIEQTRLALSKWLVVRDEGGSARYQLFHDLFRDYVFSIVRTDEVKGQHKMVADYCVGWERPAPRRINDEIVEPDYPEFVRPEWRKFRELPDPLSGAEREFALANLPYHLLQAGQWDELFETLTNFQFMEDKITHVGATEKEENGRVTRVYEGVNLLLDDYQDALAVFPRN